MLHILLEFSYESVFRLWETIWAARISKVSANFEEFSALAILKQFKWVIMSIHFSINNIVQSVEPEYLCYYVNPEGKKHRKNNNTFAPECEKCWSGGKSPLATSSPFFVSAKTSSGLRRIHWAIYGETEKESVRFSVWDMNTKDLYSLYIDCCLSVAGWKSVVHPCRW